MGPTLSLIPGRFAVCRLAPQEETPEEVVRGSLFSLTRTADELSLVCEESPDLPGRVERGWRCWRVEGPLDFDQVGVLASLAVPLADAGVSIFALSTYDTDYLLVKQEQLESAAEALRSAGHEVRL